MPTGKAWPDKETRARFFEELEALLDRYPHFKVPDDHVVDEFNMSNEHDEVFDPNSPVLRQGIVLIICHSNLEHFEDIQVLTPYAQSYYMTLGMLARADSSWGVVD